MIHDVIIIGGGISGLSTAYHLKKKKINFLLLTEEVGGRVYTSHYGGVQYGAYYVMGIYNFTKKFVKLGRRIKLKDAIFHKRGRGYSFFQLSTLKYFSEFIRFVFLLFIFRKHYSSFKRKCCHLSQADAIRNDKYLYRLYNTNAVKFVKDNKINNLVRLYVEEFLHGTTFTRVDKINAFSFMQFSLPLITPIYEFLLDKEKIINDFEKNIVIDSVDGFERDMECFIVKTKKRTYKAINLVIATPPDVSRRLLNLKEIKGAVNAHMFHIIGRVRENLYDGTYELYSDENDMLAIAVMPDKSFLFYSKKADPDLAKYFYDFEIIQKKYWKPAFNLEGHVLWDCEIDKNIYLIGDHNVCGIEDSFITGIFTANKIAEKIKQK